MIVKEKMVMRHMPQLLGAQENRRLVPRKGFLEMGTEDYLPDHSKLQFTTGLAQQHNLILVQEPFNTVSYFLSSKLVILSPLVRFLNG